MGIVIAKDDIRKNKGHISNFRLIQKRVLAEVITQVPIFEAPCCTTCPSIAASGLTPLQELARPWCGLESDLIDAVILLPLVPFLFPA